MATGKERRGVLADGNADTVAVGQVPTLPTPPVRPAIGGTLAAKLFGDGDASTAAEALFSEEIGRTRRFLELALVIVILGLAAILVAEGDPIAMRVALAGSGITFIAAIWLRWLMRRPEGYTTSRITVAAFPIAVGCYCSIYYWGLYSGASGLIVLGVYFFSLQASFRSKLTLYVACAVIHAGLAILFMTGMVRDRGIVTAAGCTTTQKLASLSAIEALYLSAFVLAHLSRRTTVDAVERLEEAVKAVAQREAVLAEARQELERAAWIGGPGRFSEQTLGSFKLGVVIGRGAMGEVYEATNVETSELAAVKLLHRNVLADPDNLARFVREARAAQALETPHVVRVFEVATTAAQIPFLAMERLQGHDLAFHLRTERRFTIEKTVDLVNQVAEALEAARVAGIVHRDLKPQNLFLHQPSNRPALWKVLDFGMSKLADQHGTLTKGQVVGTPAFMPPEQARGLEVDHRADIYALGVIVYRALTGHPAFTAQDLVAIIGDVINQMPRRPSELAALPTDIDALLAIALAKRPEDRFETAAEFADALRAASRGELTARLRGRADDLQRRLPWGARLQAHA